MRDIVESGDVMALERSRSGQARDGADVRDGGASVVELADDRIRRFQAYDGPDRVGSRRRTGGCPAVSP